MFDPDRRHLIAYLAAAAVLVVIAVRYVSRDGGSSPAASISMAAPASARPTRARPRAAPPPRPLIWVDVAGAVQQPGLYSLPSGSRVAAALERAGGVRTRADRASVNLAAKLVDGQQVFVPTRGGRSIGAAAASGSAAAGSAGSGVSGGAAASSGADGASASGAPISLTNASQEQLETLDGIGPALAQRIIEYREQHGGFKSIDQLQEVSGIGAKRFAALKTAVAP